MFPKQLTALKQWVINLPNTKIPFQIVKDSQGNYKPASTSVPDTWCTYDDAKEHLGDGNYLGFVFDDNGIVGIDIDCGFEKNGIFPTKESLDIIECCHSYTEKSKSGRGFHILVKGKLNFKGKNNLNGIEIYQDGRYFVMTGKRVNSYDLIENQKAIDYIVTKYFGEDIIEPNKSIYKPVWENIRDWHNIALEPLYPSIDKGNRNLSLTSLGGQLWTQGLPKDYIYRTLLFANSVACDTPVSTREIQMIVKSITRYNNKK